MKKYVYLVTLGILGTSAAQAGLTFKVQSDADRKLELLDSQGKVIKEILPIEVTGGEIQVIEIPPLDVKTGFTLRDQKGYGFFLSRKHVTCEPFSEKRFYGNDNGPRNSNETITFMFHGKTCTDTRFFLSHGYRAPNLD